MSTLVSLAYRSRARWPLEASAIDALLVDARTANQVADVTGALLYGDQTFLQYLEGPEDGIDEVYARIVRASQHHQLEVLHRATKPERHFQRWHMGFANAPESLLSRLSHEQWERTVPWLEDEPAPSPGLRQLLEFWNSADAGRR